jgi:serine phosphatase RsbU (regulator of sigma subunit)/FixJ family two-component response regulator
VNNFVILCVDDEKMILNSLKEQLKRLFDEQQYDIQFAESGDEALEILDEVLEAGDALALVVSDQIMPGMKGDELLVEIQNRSPETLKILLTGQSDLEAIRNAINNAQLYRYIPKPWDPEDLMLTIEQACKSFVQKRQIDSYDTQIKLLHSLNQAARDISVEVNLHVLYRKLFDHVHQLVPTHTLILIVENPDTYNRYELLCQSQDRRQQEELTYQRTHQLATFGKYLMEQCQSETGIRSGGKRMIVPIRYTKAEQFHGFLILESDDIILTDKQFEMMAVLSAQAASSIENARFVSKLDRALNDVSDSMVYAKRIQFSLLPSVQTLSHFFPQSYVFYQPKDIVSGDFYWFSTLPNEPQYLYVAVVDCTGHGVPGAFMSILGNSELNQIVNELQVSDTNDILTVLHRKIDYHLRHQGMEDLKDGMDIGLARFDTDTKTVQFSGANRPILLIRNGEYTEYFTDKIAIGHGGLLDDDDRVYHKIEIPYQPHDSFYLFTDGITDQFGGPRGKKMTRKRFVDALMEIQNQSMDTQLHYMPTLVADWQQHYEQTDDMLLIGVRIPAP